MFRPMVYSLTDNPDYKRKSLMKLITLLPDEKVLGVHIASKYADEML